jgi:hypothetical protein
MRHQQPKLFTANVVFLITKPVANFTSFLFFGCVAVEKVYQTGDCKQLGVAK